MYAKFHLFSRQSERIREAEVNFLGCKELRKHFFTNRVVQQWNELPEAVKAAESVNMFKNRYDGWRQSQLTNDRNNTTNS